MNLECSYLMYSPQWYDVTASHPSLREVRVECRTSISALALAYEIVYEQPAAVVIPNVPPGGHLTAESLKEMRVALQRLLPSLYYMGRNAYFSDTGSYFFFVVDMEGERKFVNSKFAPNSDCLANTRGRLKLIDKNFEGWID